MLDRATIVGLVVAAYGAVLSTINSIVQVLNHRRDRVDVVLQVRSNMSPDMHRYAGMKLTLVTAANRGKRPVTIEGFSTKLLDSRREYLLMDIRPALPCTLSESQTVTAFVDEAGADPTFIEGYYVWDSVGRKFYANIASWPRRCISLHSAKVRSS